MNKAKITYRFNTEKNHLQPVSEFPKAEKAIPLHPTQSDADLPREAEETTLAAGNANTRQPPPIYDVQPLNQFTSDFGAWSSPFDIETEKLEKLIRDSDPAKTSETARKQTAELHALPRPDTTSAIPRSGPDISEVSVSQYAKRSGLRFPSWGKLLLSASSAVITGVLLGTVILNMFPGSPDSTVPSGETPAVTEIPQSELPGQGGDNGSIAAQHNGDSAAGMPVLSSVQLASADYYFLQNGVFSSEESAAEAQAILREKGLASIVDASDGYRVYAGFSNNRDEALFLSNWIQEQELETYIKPVSRPAVTMIEWPEGNHQSFESYINGSSDLIHTMNAWTSQLLRNQSQSVTNDQLTELKAMHQAWSNHAVSVANSAAGDLGSHLGKMNAFMNTAVESFSEYAKNPYETYLWQAQAAMMHYIFLEKALLHAVTP